MNAASVLVLVVLAQASTTGTNAQDRAKAQGLLVEGATLYERGDYLGALDRFNAAYGAYPSSKIWFNIGQANRALGRQVEARTAYRRFLDEVPNASPADRSDAEAWLANLERSLAPLTVVCETAGAEISVDGRAVGQAPLSRPVWTAPGRHQVTATSPGSCPMVESVNLLAGFPGTVTLKPLHAPLGAAAVDLAAPAQPQAPDQGWWLGRKWTWVAAGGTVLLTGAAAVVGLSMQARFDDLKRSCGRGSPEQLGCSQSDIDGLHTRKVAANVLWGLAGAAAVATGVLFFVEGRPVTVVPVAGSVNGMFARVEL